MLCGTAPVPCKFWVRSRGEHPGKRGQCSEREGWETAHVGACLDGGQAVGVGVEGGRGYACSAVCLMRRGAGIFLSCTAVWQCTKNPQPKAAVCTPAGLRQMALTPRLYYLLSQPVAQTTQSVVPQASLQRLASTDRAAASACCAAPAAFVMHGTKAAYLTNAVFGHIFVVHRQTSLCRPLLPRVHSSCVLRLVALVCCVD